MASPSQGRGNRLRDPASADRNTWACQRSGSCSDRTCRACCSSSSSSPAAAAASASDLAAGLRIQVMRSTQGVLLPVRLLAER